VPETWLARGGFFHSENMKVFERFTRKGDEILYEVTVDDPDVLLQPWKQKPVVMTKAVANAGGFGSPTLVGTERGNCEAYDPGNISSQIRH
jgi:hypothetical protein